ncbi:HNH endonuclease signature motif containing protein [Smaragdicoccus niigatensis]|uniref:HNH endonuclease signature motif containing protein n=1 Tax=Smaragdicoccus niigatensis TaxID=359359 RepID=UPI00037060A4|nr:HNH endonuclease signature motif containing protein [Smaragdicoccus niigatensis]
MFDTVLTAATTAANPVAGVDAAILWHRIESAAAARKLAFVGEVLARHLNECETPVGTLPGGVDPADAAEAEIAAALGITCSTAGRWMWLGHTLATRLPNLAATFAAGELTEHQVQTIATCTANVDPDFIKEVEAHILSALKGSSARLVGKKLRAVIDAVIIRVDPDGLRARRDAAVLGRHVHVHPATDGMAELAGSLTAEDATFLDRRLDEMAKRVCSDDPRSFSARRADALVALTHGRPDLDCLCGDPACPFTADIAGTPRRPLVHVIAPADTLTGESDAPGWIDGFGFISAEHLRAIAAAADLRALHNPTVSDAVADYFAETPEDRYRPSQSLADWVKAVHGWCAFPGCGQPAWESDLDHRTPRSADGDTASFNLGPFCRKHHNLHTHGGWETEQLIDGTLILTSREGRVYRVPPLGPIPLLSNPVPMRPKRQPRAQGRVNRVRRERKRAHDQNNEPPPF